jgi:serine/threonine protein kinase
MPSVRTPADVSLVAGRDDSTKGRLDAATHTEMQAMRAVSHPHVVRMFGCTVMTGRNFIGILMQLCSEGSLVDFQTKMGGRLEEQMMLTFAYEVASGLDALHDAGIVHRDMKRSNTLVCRFGKNEYAVKLCDFGVADLSRLLEARLPESSQTSTMPTGGGTSRYLPPELMEESGGWEKHCARDVYAYGHVLYEMATDRIPYAGLAEHQAAVKISQNVKPKFDPKDQAPAWLVELATLCWESDPEVRMSHFGGAAETNPMKHIMGWLREHCKPELVRETLLQMARFEFYDIRHPFLDDQ